MNQLSEKRTNALIAGKILDILTEKEEQELQKWLSEKPDHRNRYERMIQSGYRNQRDEYIENLKIDERWEQLKTSHLLSKHKILRINRHFRIGIAASIIILLTIGWFWNSDQQKSTTPQLARVTTPIPGSSKAMLVAADGKQYILQDTSLQIALNQKTQLVSDGKKLSYAESVPVAAASPTEMNTIIIPRGGEYEVILSDQTKVYLNAGSRLRFPVQFGKGKREVELEGEAYFKVSKDSLHPFVVRVTDRLEVEVLGTEFNITAYPEDLTIATTLNTGAVRVSDGEHQLRLHPDQQAVFFKNSGDMECRDVDAWVYSAWTEGRIVLRNVTLEELMERLSRWYDLRVIWRNEQIKNYHFSGEVLRYENFSEILNMLEKATSVQFNITGNQIEIRQK